MMRKTILAGVLLLAAAPMALAQPAPPPPGGPERGPRAEERDRDDDRDRDRDRDEDRDRDRERDRDEDRGRDERRGERGDRDRDRGHHREHGERRGPPHGPGGGGREAGAGFRIDLGPAGSLDVRCGNEAFRPCVDAVRPLIDAMSGARPGAEPRPAPGLAPLPPADANAPDVPLPDDVSADTPPALPDGLAGEPAPAN